MSSNSRSPSVRDVSAGRRSCFIAICVWLPMTVSWLLLSDFFRVLQGPEWICPSLERLWFDYCWVLYALALGMLRAQRALPRPSFGLRGADVPLHGFQLWMLSLSLFVVTRLFTFPSGFWLSSKHWLGNSLLQPIIVFKKLV